MGTAVCTAGAWLTLLGTMVLSQTVTFDYDRTAAFSSVQIRMPGRATPTAGRTEPRTYRSIG